MTKHLQVWKCSICGNIIIVLHEGADSLVCCGQPMGLMPEQTADFTTEKHVPVIGKTEAGVLVKVGSTPHPMEDAHFIEWVELITGDGVVHRAFLRSGGAPEYLFKTSAGPVGAREYCNVHGLWKS